MAHLVNNSAQQDAGEILLSGFTQMALQMEAQRRLMKPGSKPRRGKKGQKKQPQRGLGVAQLEKIRLEEQRRVSQQVEHLAVLRQLHAGTPPYTHPNAPVPTSMSIIRQIDRESNLSSLLLPTPPVTISPVAHMIPPMDSIANSFLFKNVPPLSSIVPSTPATPLELFPSGNFQAATAPKNPDRSWMDRNFYILQAPGEWGRARGENLQSLHALSCNRSKESQDDGGPSCPSLSLRRSIASTPSLTETNSMEIDVCHPSQVQPIRMVSPSFPFERMMELSSFQNAMSSGPAGQHEAVKRQACGVVWAGSQLSELPGWMTSFSAHSKPVLEHESHSGRSEDVCELTLELPGGSGPPRVNKQQLCAAKGPNSFLSLAVESTWLDSAAESSSTPSPASATTTKSSANDVTSTEEHMSASVSSWSSLPNTLPITTTQPRELQMSLFSFDTSLDLTLKL